MTVQKSTNQGKKLIILGFVTIGILFLMLWQIPGIPSLLTPSAIDSIQRIAYGFYVILLGILWSHRPWNV